MRMYPKDRARVTVGVNTVLYNPTESDYDVRGQQSDNYIGGWFSSGWFPGEMWWGEGNTT